MDRRVEYDANPLENNVVSPYLRRPLRSLSEALADRHDPERHSCFRPPQIPTVPREEG